MRNSVVIAIAGATLALGCQPKTETTSSGSPSPIPAVSSTALATPAPQASVTPGVSGAHTVPGEGESAPKVTLGNPKGPLPEGVTLTTDHRGAADMAFAMSGDKTGLATDTNIDPEAMPTCTLVTWARFTGDPTKEETQQVVSHDDGGYDRSMGLDGRAGKWGWSAFVGNQAVAGGFPVEVNKWTFLAVVYDQPNRTATFYAGDQKVTVADVEMGSGLQATSVGTNPSYGEHFMGDIEPIKVYDRALSEAEIATLRGTPGQAVATPTISGSPSASPSTTPSASPTP